MKNSIHRNLLFSLILTAVFLTTTSYAIAAQCFKRAHVLIDNRSGARLIIEVPKRVTIDKGLKKRIYSKNLTLSAEGYDTVNYSAPTCKNKQGQITGYNALKITYQKKGEMKKEWL